MSKTRQVEISISWTTIKQFAATVPADWSDTDIEDMAYDNDDAFLLMENGQRYPQELEFEDGNVTVVKCTRDYEFLDDVEISSPEVANG